MKHLQPCTLLSESLLTHLSRPLLSPFDLTGGWLPQGGCSASSSQPQPHWCHPRHPDAASADENPAPQLRKSYPSNFSALCTSFKVFFAGIVNWKLLISSDRMKFWWGLSRARPFLAIGRDREPKYVSSGSGWQSLLPRRRRMGYQLWLEVPICLLSVSPDTSRATLTASHSLQPTSPAAPVQKLNVHAPALQDLAHIGISHCSIITHEAIIKVLPVIKGYKIHIITLEDATDQHNLLFLFFFLKLPAKHPKMQKSDTFDNFQKEEFLRNVKGYRNWILNTPYLNRLISWKHSA